MTGEVDLKKLIQGMRPELNQGEYVYCLMDSKERAKELDPLCYFHEKEGVTVSDDTARKLCDDGR